MNTAFSFDIFLSHNVNDKQRVRSLAERLRAEGLRVWFDEWAIKPGDDIYLAVEHGLEAARVLVLCLSEHALGSDWVKMERSTVLFRDPSNKGRRFIPLLLDDCKLPDALRRFKYVDFRHEAEGAFLNLLAACRSRADEDNQSFTNEDIKPYARPIVPPERICEEIDFLTPIDDPHFYLGMDVQPGHLAAGLVVERPAARQRTLNALDARRNVLIVGPSGSGKSALMWEVARAASHVEKWFRIRSLSVDQVSSLVSFVKTYRASIQTPVGFAFDDIGRGLTEGWDALAREAASLPGIILLGSAREEDLFPLTERARAIEIREVGDDELAERLWKELRRRSQTQSAGWREPWQESKGLLLEYTYFLSEGTRLTDVLRAQVANRVRDIGRDGELAVLRVAAAAGAAGATVDVERLPMALKLSEAEISLALRRLFDEHLIRDIGSGRIGALHQLRAKELFHLCHEFPPPTAERTIATTLHCLPAEDIETFIVRTCELNAEWQERLVDEIIVRLNQEPDPVIAVSALRGLGQAHIVASVSAWLKRPDVQALPRTQLTCVALFGLPGIEPLDIPQLAHLQAASRSFCSAIEISAHNNPRNQLISRLSSDTTSKLFSQKTCLRVLNELLSAIIGTEIPSNLLDQLSSIQPDLKADSIEDVANLLGTVGLIDPGIAKIWVDAAGQQTLLDRIYDEVPWVSRPELRHEEEGLAVCADLHCVAASCQPDTHSEVVHLCELLLAIAPQAELAISNAVSQDGEIAGYGDFQLATKRIPRKNLPPSALPDWNKRWRIAVADRVAAPSYTDYLSRAAIILRGLVATLENVLDEWFRKGKVSEANCERLNSNNNQAETLTPPRFSPQASTGKGSAEKNIAVTDLQNVLFDCSVNLIKRFNKLPEDANCYIAWTGGILKHIDAATENEPWELLDEVAPKELQRLRQIVEGLRFMAGESGVRNVNPIQTWHKPKAQRKTAFRLAAHVARGATERRLPKSSKLWLLFLCQ
ncbi:toll/interleukin-1 receptor domain-containing protein [Methylobacter sp.]|uniref:toll/interleukin-1 receptor domain-containing protein n=1 Tax=Methylobacter sp. TaxID=2051955 RepID=UPI002FDE51B1